MIPSTLLLRQRRRYSAVAGGAGDHGIPEIRGGALRADHHQVADRILQIGTDVGDLPPLFVRPARTAVGDGHEGAFPLHGTDDAAVLHDVERLKDGLTGDAEAFRQLLFGWNPFAGGKNAGGDFLRQLPADFPVFRLYGHIRSPFGFCLNYEKEIGRVQEKRRFF